VRFVSHEHRTYRLSSQALSGTLNLKSALHRVLEILAKHHGAVRSMVTFLAEDGELTVEASDGLEEPQTVRYRIGEGITGRVVASSKPVVVPRVSREPELVHRAARRSESREELSFVCVPILVNRKAAGALGCRLEVDALPNPYRHLDSSKPDGSGGGSGVIQVATPVPNLFAQITPQ